MVDRLTREQRSALMARVRSYDTKPERVLRSALHRIGLRFRKHVRDLPGRPDAVFVRARVAVFVDGDFWHGYRFPQWSSTLPEYWRTKITRNRLRDRRNFAALRRRGWKVVRVWEHDINRDVALCVLRVSQAVLQGMRSHRA